MFLCVMVNTSRPPASLGVGVSKPARAPPATATVPVASSIEWRHSFHTSEKATVYSKDSSIQSMRLLRCQRQRRRHALEVLPASTVQNELAQWLTTATRAVDASPWRGLHFLHSGSCQFLLRPCQSIRRSLRLFEHVVRDALRTHGKCYIFLINAKIEQVMRP